MPRLSPNNNENIHFYNKLLKEDFLYTCLFFSVRILIYKLNPNQKRCQNICFLPFNYSHYIIYMVNAICDVFFCVHGTIKAALA